MTTHTDTLQIERDAPISTWFRIGGHAAQLAKPESIEQLRQCIELDDECKVLGEGANLLVDDSGIDHLVVSMQTDGFKLLDMDTSTGIVHAGAGVALPRLITQTVNAGLSGLQGLAGFPATIGGAVIMNAGGRFGTISDHLIAVHAMDRAGRMHELRKSEIDFDYRHSGLNHLLVCSAVFKLTPADTKALKQELSECMKYKTESQPMSAKSAGCAFKNPTLHEHINDIGEQGTRVSAGMLIDRAGCKGLSIGGASVSELHANFITTTQDAKAREVIDLMHEVQRRVHDTFGIQLHNEVVIWTKEQERSL